MKDSEIGTQVSEVSMRDEGATDQEIADLRSQGDPLLDDDDSFEVENLDDLKEDPLFARLLDPLRHSYNKLSNKK